MIVNFGRNIRFQPSQYLEPGTEDEVLQALNAHPDRRFRAVGARHSWSTLLPAEDICISLKHLNSVKLTTHSNGRVVATVGGGCTIHRLLELLNHEGLTLPTVGQITSQTVAGAVATATHGSGRYSLSHYMRGIRIAALSNGKAVVHSFQRGPEMAAARCSLGSMGIILEVQFVCVAQYDVAETRVLAESMEQVAKLEYRNSIQEFQLVPFWDEFEVVARRSAKANDTSSGLKIWLQRVYRSVWYGIVFHMLIVLLGRYRERRGLVRWFYQRVYPRLLLRDRLAVDRSDRILTWTGDRFVHFETEIFVTESHLNEAVEFVRIAMRAFATRKVPVSESFARWVSEAGMTERLHQLRGTWTHHYPVCVRKVLPDDSLVSMSAGTEACYAFSFVTWEKDRRDFRNFSSFLTRTMASAFNARPHWGKHIDLKAEEVVQLYPKFGRFQRICRRIDPKRQFGNSFVDDLLQASTATDSDESSESAK